MPDKTWKAFERRCSQLLGTRRIPVTGERAGADAENSLFCFQFKKRAILPGYIFDWLAGIRVAAAARTPPKIGVVVMQVPGGQDLDAVVVVSLRDWLDLHGPIRPAVERERTIAAIAATVARAERQRKFQPDEPSTDGHPEDR